MTCSGKCKGHATIQPPPGSTAVVLDHGILEGEAASEFVKLVSSGNMPEALKLLDKHCKSEHKHEPKNGGCQIHDGPSLADKLVSLAGQVAAMEDDLKSADEILAKLDEQDHYADHYADEKIELLKRKNRKLKKRAKKFQDLLAAQLRENDALRAELAKLS